MRPYFAVVAFFLSVAVAASCQQTAAPAAPDTGTWKISGRVVDAATGIPLSRAEVTLGTATRFLQTVVADGDGRFVFEKLALGTYVLLAQHPGYIRESFEERDHYSAGVDAGPNAPKDLVFRLHREASIFGKVTDEQNQPVPYATVMLIQAGAFNGRRFSHQRNSARTDEEGNYTLRHLPPGNYFILVSAEPWYAQRPGYLHATQQAVGPLVTAQPDQRAAPPALDVVYPLTFYPASASLANASEIRLSSGNEFTADVRLQTMSALYAQVPFPDLDLDQTFIEVQQMVPGMWKIPAHVVTARTSPGNMEIGGLAPGRYRVATYLTIQNNKFLRKPGPVREIEIAGNLQADLKPESARVSVTGHVDIQPWKITKSVSISLRDQDSGEAYSAYASDVHDWEFTLGAPAGTYDVLLGGTGLFLQSVKAQGAETAGLTVRILHGSQPKLTITATPAVTQIGGTAFKNGKPFPGAMMVLVPDDPMNNLQWFRRDESNMDGSYAFLSVLPGRYTILALENGWDLDWGDPKVWQPLVAQGSPIQVEAQKKYRFQAKIQSIAAQR